jgi:GNAT superfamily N-acetyltransferase
MNYELRQGAAAMDVDAIHAFLGQTYWAQGIPREIVARSIANSLCVGTFHDGAQVGFARVVSDRATFGYLADVYVLEAHRGQRLAQRMVRALLDLPELQGLRKMLLGTRDAHALYAKFGFQPLRAPERIMERHDPAVYQLKSAHG